MASNKSKETDKPASVTRDDNIIQPFQLDESGLRGRSVKVGSVLDDVLGPHDYPNPVAHLVAEMMTVGLLLSSMLKYKGIFTLQAQGNGPVSTLIADVNSEGDVRGCALFDEKRLEMARTQIQDLAAPETGQNNLAQYLGKGHIAFTVDQGPQTERYQGIVDLKGASITDCVQHYFGQSEQIGTGIKLAVGERGGKWRSGGIMLQRMPENEKNPQDFIGNVREDDWRRAMILLDTCTEDELLDEGLHVNELLLRLFHEDGVRVFDTLSVQKGCRCDSKKLENVLALMDKDDIEHMKKDDKITMHCEFCSKDLFFDGKTLKML